MMRQRASVYNYDPDQLTRITGKRCLREKSRPRPPLDPTPRPTGSGAKNRWIILAVGGRAIAATCGIAERAWHASRQGRTSRTHAARRETLPPIVGSGAERPPS